MRDLTEGIDLAKLHWPFLKRNLPPLLETEEEYSRVYIPQSNSDNLVIRINANNYHLQYEPNTQDFWVHDKVVRRRGMERMEEAKEQRKTRIRRKFGADSTAWMQGMTKEEADQANEDFKGWFIDQAASAEQEPNPAPDAAVMES